MPHPVILLDNVFKQYGAFNAVNGLSFNVQQGEIFGFLGPNGAGKTSTLRMMLDIIQPTAGRIEIFGATSAIPIRHRIGYLPEERGLYKKMRAGEAIAYFAELRGVSRADAKSRAHDLLEQFGLGAFIKTKCEALSKGMAQKVQLLATIAHEPDLLILDEPFSGLDPINQQTLEKLIADQRAAGRTIIFSTHVMQHAERLCDRFLILAKGEKRFEGTLAQARGHFSQRIHLRTTATKERIVAVGGVQSIRTEDKAKEETTFEIELQDGAHPQDFLKRAVAAGLAISRFEQAGATLHDIFVSLASDPDAPTSGQPRQNREHAA